MVVGLGAFLALARPSGGHHHASASMWILSGVATFGFAAVLTAAAYLPGRAGRSASGGRKAALLGMAAAAGFGFVAAVIKELSTHLSQVPSGIFLNWSPYVLLLAGAAAFFLASNAFQAGSLASSQPGLTVVDPLVASLLGVILFGERLDHHPLIIAGEVPKAPRSCSSPVWSCSAGAPSSRTRPRQNVRPSRPRRHFHCTCEGRVGD